GATSCAPRPRGGAPPTAQATGESAPLRPQPHRPLADAGGHRALTRNAAVRAAELVGVPPLRGRSAREPSKKGRHSMKRKYPTSNDYCDLCAVQQWEDEGGCISPPRTDVAGEFRRTSLRHGPRCPAATDGNPWKPNSEILRSRLA